MHFRKRYENSNLDGKCEFIIFLYIWSKSCFLKDMFTLSKTTAAQILETDNKKGLTASKINDRMKDLVNEIHIALKKIQ